MEEEEKKGRELTNEEQKEMKYGFDLEEMTKTAGWGIVLDWLEQRAFHTWADPRETDNEKSWMWRELNAFHSADVSKQIIEDINKAINRAHYLKGVELGEIKEHQRMRI